MLGVTCKHAELCFAGCCRQKGCIEQDDLLRPYSSLDYAWDEPALPHKLLLELPGNRKLGEYELDNVGFQKVVTVHATAQRAEQRIQVCVRADGPKRVLQLIDSLVRPHKALYANLLLGHTCDWRFHVGMIVFCSRQHMDLVVDIM